MLKFQLPKKCIKVLFIFGFAFGFINTTYAQDTSSPNFIIKGENLSAGGAPGDSANFSIEGDVNPFSDTSVSSSFRQLAGFNPRIQAITPYSPLLANTTTTYYDRLLLTINPSGNPSDSLYAVIVSSDDFVTYEYLQNDNTLGTTLGPEDYQTYTSWGGASGSLILGLNQNTSYKARVKALNGDFTETGYGPASAEATTTVPFINLNVSENQVNFGTLSANSVSQTTTLDVSVNTNSETGYQSYLNGTGNTSNGGLYNGSNLILSATTILSPGTEGYGAQGSSGTSTIDPKYDITGNNVGSVDTTDSTLASNTIPVLNEITTVLFKVAISGSTQAGEYSDVVYFTISPVL